MAVSSGQTNEDLFTSLFDNFTINKNIKNKIKNIYESLKDKKVKFESELDDKTTKKNNLEDAESKIT